MKGKLRMSPYRRAREELLSGRDATRIQAMADLEAAIRADQRRIDAEPAAGDEELTREELQALVDDLGQQAYRAGDLIDFVREMCDSADRDGSEVTTARVRGWLAYTGCGGAIVLPEDVQEQVRAALVGSSTQELRITVTAPTPADAERWTQGIRDMVTAEFGDSMRLDISTGPLRRYATGGDLAGSFADIPLTSRNAADIKGEGQ